MSSFAISKLLGWFGETDTSSHYVYCSIVIHIYKHISSVVMRWLKRLAIKLVSRRGWNMDDKLREESVKVKALKSEVQLLTELLANANERFRQQEAELKHFRGQQTIEKYLPIIAKLFGFDLPSMPSPEASITAIGIQQPLNEMSNEQIRQTLSKFPKEQISIALNMGDTFVTEQLKNYMPNISEDTIKRALIIAKEMITTQ